MREKGLMLHSSIFHMSDVSSFKVQENSACQDLENYEQKHFDHKIFPMEQFRILYPQIVLSWRSFAKFIAVYGSIKNVAQLEK
jgi:hypothetical protein